MCQVFLFSLIFWAFLFLHHQSISAEKIRENVNELENNVNSPAQYSNFYGKNSELFHSRKKRFLDPITWTVGTVVMLAVWSGFLAPFLQAQISLKINIFRWFDDEACLKRMVDNKFKSFCKPTNEELFVREFIHQANMKIFKNITKETAELLQYEHSRTIQIHEPPANPEHSLSERESLFLTLFKNRLIPYGQGKISKWLLADEDKYSKKLYAHFDDKVWSKLPTEEICKEKRENWIRIKNDKKATLGEDLFHKLLECECIPMQGDWIMANKPISVETVKNCRELLEFKKVVPEKEEMNKNEPNINKFTNGINNGDEIEEEEEEAKIFYTAPLDLEFEKVEEKILIKEISEQIKGVKRNVNEKNIVEEEKRNEARRKKLNDILSDFLLNFNVDKKQIEFLKRLEQNLLGMQRKETIKPLSQSSKSNFFHFSKISFPTCGRSNSHNSTNKENEDVEFASVGEDLDEEKSVLEDHCQIKYENYGEKCLIDWNHDLEHIDLRKVEFAIADKTFYPKNLITLFEKTFKLAKGQFEQFKQKFPNISSEIKMHIGKKHLLIIFRRILCRIYEFAREENFKEEKKKKKLKFIQKINIFSKGKNGGLKMAKNVLKQFGQLCEKFYERNLKERRELLAIEGFEELDEKGQKMNDEIFDQIELVYHHPGQHMNAGLSNGHSSRNFYSVRISPSNNERQINSSEELQKPKKGGFIEYISKLPQKMSIRKKRSNKYYAENGGEENKIGIYKTGGLIRRKRAPIALAILSFTASLLFLQIYLRFFAKKYDPITWLWMCMKYPRSHCQIPEAMRNEMEFLENGKGIAQVEMPFKTVVDLRKFYEMNLPILLKINLKKVKQNLMRPSQFFAAYSVKLNRRHQILLDCFYYDWESDQKKPKNLDNLLAPIIEANKKNCILFKKFMEEEMIPKKLKHILTHCSQIGGRVNVLP